MPYGGNIFTERVHEPIGCFRKLEFDLPINYQPAAPSSVIKDYDDYVKFNGENGFDLKVRVFRIVRWLNNEEDRNRNIHNRKYKDWKIQVSQKNTPYSYDVLSFFKLPCDLENIREYIYGNKGHLYVKFAKNVRPKTIESLMWRINDVVDIYSQKYYDNHKELCERNFKATQRN